MATLFPLYKNNFIIAVIVIFFLHLLYVTASTNFKINNGGFSAHLIRRDSPNSPFYKYRNKIKISRRLMDPKRTGYTLQNNRRLGGHIMKLSVGTPASDVYLIADTGSTLLWTQCQPCKACYNAKYPMFDPRKSLTYKNFTCGARECGLVDDQRPLHIQKDFCEKFPRKMCPYGVMYADNASSEGVLSKEMMILKSRTGKDVALKDIFFGCGYVNNANANGASGDEMGVIGLGRGNLSFPSQISPYVGGNKFSHCLVTLDTDPKIESKINFGSGSEVLGDGVVTTPLRTDQVYAVAVEGVTIGNVFVPFNSIVKTSSTKLGMLIDSGSTFSMVPRYIFDRVTTQLVKTVDPKLPSNFVTVLGNTYLCFNSTTIPKEPKMTFHFEGGKLQLMGDQIFKLDQEHNRFCFGMCSNAEALGGLDIGIFGAIFQGNVLIGFDLDKNLVSFKLTDCVNY